MDYSRIENVARDMRRKMIDVSHFCDKSVHMGGALSSTEIMATLYSSVLKFDKANPTWEDRDRFILSKGHGALVYYTALRVADIISEDVFGTFMTNGSHLTTHPIMNLSLGMESSNGSLGQGLSMGVGLALGAKRKGKNHKIYVLLGDGECNEGSVWEAAMAAANFKLDNLVAVVDVNGFQNDGSAESVMECGDFMEKWASFGWDALPVDGHNVKEIYDAFTCPVREGKPKILVASTVKGKGFSFMENNNDWHHNRLTKSFYEKALQEWEQSS